MTDAPIGVLLAAGRGRRAGGDKQLFPWPTAAGERPMVSAVFQTMRSVCSTIVVVTGFDQDDVRAAVDPAAVLVEASSDAPMSESVVEGLRAAQRAAPQRRVLLQLVDFPAVRPATLRELVAATAQDDTEAYWVPAYQGQTGHPLLLTAPLAQAILNDGIPHGLRDFLRQHAASRQIVAVEDPFVLRDVDTMDDYHALRRDVDT
ncbi:MAG: NTP transferase domain-containing protein [Planctomycetales bacterium]|nr:NTP transferase domain-containing protein [Planctomycetales bacterium]